MKLLDVRVGNTVFKDGKVKNVSVCALGDLLSFSDHFKGIPLTEEWLFKFGFANIGEGEFHKDWKFKGVMVRYKKENKKYLIGTWTDSDDDCGIIWLDYVHELENIFYAITKRELAWLVSPKTTDI